MRALELSALDPPTPGVTVAGSERDRLRPRPSRRWAPDLEGSRWAAVFPDQIQTDGVDPGGPRPGDLTDSYHSWRAVRLSDRDEHDRARREIAGLGHRPLFSIVTPVHNLPPDVLSAMIESVQAQVYPHWQLCLADDGATWPATRAVLTRAAYHDPRISLVRRATNGGIVAASNTALALARGEFVALLDHDDELDPMALFEVARLLDRHPELDVVYTDEEKKDEQGVVRWPALKPSFSPDLLTCGNYMCHFSVYRRSVLEAVGGFRDGYDGAQDLDLVLRVVDHTDRVGHIAKPLYSWRMVSGSVAADGDAKPYAFPNGRRAIEDALTRRGIEGTVVERPERGLYRVRYRVAGRPRVVMALHADQVVDAAGADWLGELARFTDGPFPEVVVLDGRLTPGRARDPYRSVASRLDLPGARPGEVFNHLLATTDADLVLWLDIEARPLDSEWLMALVEHAQRDGVGACGGQLLGADGSLSMGRLVPPDEPALDERPAENHFLSAIGESHLLVERNVAALGPVCTMARVVALDGIGGVDTSLNDHHLRVVDATMRMRVRGQELVGTPYARCSMPVTGHRPPAGEWERFRRRWRVGEGFVDPYFNPNYRALRALVPSG
ncbi:MAG: glycosyltransferase [Miltoncostaeaceae bacterium]